VKVITLLSGHVKLGKNVYVHATVNLVGCQIGDRSCLGAFVEVQKKVKIGKNCQISSHSFLCEKVSIADNVMIGHHVTFTHDGASGLYSRNGKSGRITVRKGATIGSGTTLLPGIIIGENAIIAPGSLVTVSVPAREVWSGNPAQFVKKIK